MKHLKCRRELKVEEAHRRCCLNMRFGYSRARRCYFGCNYLSALVRAEVFQFGFLLLPSTVNYQLDCGSLADSSLFPAIAKP
jgi:hypothetical protein